jgi:hypothetical protein
MCACARAAALIGDTAAFLSVHALPKVSRAGRFLYIEDGSRFYIKGVGYQEQGPFLFFLLSTVLNDHQARLLLVQATTSASRQRSLTPWRNPTLAQEISLISNNLVST